jgi:AcrR family transcriptional regulator
VTDSDLDPRAQRTRLALVEAMAELLETRDPLDLTVTEIVARAGVSRPTFYQQAGDIPALVAAAGLDRLSAIFARSDARTAGLDADGRARDTIENLVGELARNREFYRRVLRGSHDTAARVTEFVETRLHARIGADPTDPRVADRITVVAAGATALIIRWLDDEPGEPPARMAARLLDVIVALTPAASVA